MTIEELIKGLEKKNFYGIDIPAKIEGEIHEKLPKARIIYSINDWRKFKRNRNKIVIVKDANRIIEEENIDEIKKKIENSGARFLFFFSSLTSNNVYEFLQNTTLYKYEREQEKNDNENNTQKYTIKFFRKEIKISEHGAFSLSQTFSRITSLSIYVVLMIVFTYSFFKSYIEKNMFVCSFFFILVILDNGFGLDFVRIRTKIDSYIFKIMLKNVFKIPKDKIEKKGEPSFVRNRRMMGLFSLIIIIFLFVFYFNSNWEKKVKYEQSILLGELKSLNNFIVFSSDRDGNYEIYKMNADGSNQKRLTYTSFRDDEPTVSPDGRKIAFSSFREPNVMDTTSGSNLKENFDIYIMNSDGSDKFEFANESYNDLRFPVWSLDGAEIAFEKKSSRYFLPLDKKKEELEIKELNHVKFYFKHYVLKVNGKSYTLYSKGGDIYIKNENGIKVKLTNSGCDKTPSWGPPVPLIDKDTKKKKSHE